MRNEDDGDPSMNDVVRFLHEPANDLMKDYFYILASAGIPGLSISDIFGTLHNLWGYYVLVAFNPQARTNLFCRIVDVDESRKPTLVSLMPGYCTTKGFIDREPPHIITAGIICCNGLIERRYVIKEDNVVISLKDLDEMSKNYGLDAMNKLNRRLSVQQRIFFHAGAKVVIEDKLPVLHQALRLHHTQHAYINPVSKKIISQ